MKIISRTLVIFWTVCCVMGDLSTSTSLNQEHGVDPHCWCKKGSWMSSCEHMECSCISNSSYRADGLPQSITWSFLETNCTNVRAANSVCGPVRILGLSRCVFKDGELVLDHFAIFPELRQLSVTDVQWSDGYGALQLRNHVLRFDHVTELNLSGNALLTIHSAALSAFSRLEVLILDGNNLTSLGKNSFQQDWKLKAISLGGNCWSCDGMSWFIEWMRSQSTEVRPRILNTNTTRCHHNDFRNSTGCTTFSNLIELCPMNCTCSLYLYQIRVDCSNKQLLTFPQVVPVNTSTVHLQNNLIDSLDSLVGGINYNNLRHLHLDNNSISSIDLLNKAVCFSGLVSLSLAGNKLKRINWIIIDSLICESHTDVRLGNNPWVCECDAISKFYDLLFMFPKKFQDIEDIRCAVNGTQLSGEIIYRLKKFQLCWNEAARIARYHPSDIIDPILSILIIAIAAKLIYDYYKFKYSGKLPFGPLNLCQTVAKYAFEKPGSRKKFGDVASTDVGPLK